jgi:SpoVK/Ycf46/Vps4 family AAA+-type ATPase
MKQWLRDFDGQNEKFRSELVQFARFGASGDIERLKVQALRLIRMLRSEGDDLADAIQNAVFADDRAARTHPVRSTRKADLTLAEPLPTDEDTRTDLLRAEDPPVLVHALVRSPSLQRQIVQLISERRAGKKLMTAGLDAPKSVLFTGPPGVGKTESAREIALALNVPLLILDMATVISSLLGRSGNNVKQAFAFARRTPCVLFLDEIDAVAKRRDDDGDIGELKRLVTVLLQEIDLWPANNLLIAATNHVQLLDTAVTRRFDQTITFPRPVAGELAVLARHITAKHANFPKGWAEILAELMDGTSHSDFVRDLNRLRRALVLGGKTEGVKVLKELTHERAPELPKDVRKKVAVGLVDRAGVAQREASRITKLARDTLKLALQGVSDP